MITSHDGGSGPLCFLLAGGETEVDSPRDTVLTNDLATAMVASYWFPNNPGAAISTRQHNEPAGGQDMWRRHSGTVICARGARRGEAEA